MWKSSPGIFEMMMKFFSMYNESIKINSKSFEVACRDFMEEIFDHYETCAIKRIGCCRCNTTSSQLPISDFVISGNHISQVKEETCESEAEDINEIGDSSQFSFWNDADKRSQSFSEFNVMESARGTTNFDNMDMLQETPEKTDETEMEINTEKSEACIETVFSDVKTENVSDFSSAPAVEMSPVHGNLQYDRLSYLFEGPADVAPAETSVLLMDNTGITHRPSRVVQELGTGLKRNPTKRCRLCYRERRARRETRFWCVNCPTKPGLCLQPCFRIWHELINAYEQTSSTSVVTVTSSAITANTISSDRTSIGNVLEDSAVS